MSTVGLSMITNDFLATLKFLDKYGEYFDKWFITVADKNKDAYSKLLDAFIDSSKLEISYFKWVDDFAAARNYNLTTVTTDYWMWVDTDDEIVNPERIGELVRYMGQNELDIIQLKYDYAQNEQGDAISDHWRERIVKRGYEGTWSTPVHEIIQGPPAHLEKSAWVTIKHTKTADDVVKSMERNKKILQKHFEATKDPRDAYYLGMTALGQKDPETAIQYFLQHIRTSGWDEDQYRSWCRIADCEWIRRNFDQALYATDEAARLKPEFPDAYFIKVLIYTTTERFDKGIEWLKVALAKPEPTTLSIVDPTLYKYRGMAMGAQCYLFSGRVKEAFRLYQAVIEQNPKAFDEDMAKLFEDAYFDSKAIDYTKWLLHYTKGNGGKPLKLFDALPERVLADPRLNAERVNFYPKVTWPAKSLAIYCGPNIEPWGPDTLDKGMGGSEEAVVYLSRELAKLGWQVTVFNDREKDYQERWDDKHWYAPESDTTFRNTAVIYRPWTLLNPYDQFDVFCAWRAPSFTRGIKARKKIIDLHDTPIGHQTISNADIEATDLFMFKSRFQTQYAPNVPKEKTKVIPNGLVASQFDHDPVALSLRRNHSVGWFSSYDRGFDVLLAIWPEVLKAVPDATIDCAYGWNSFDHMHRKNPERMKWKWQMIRKFNEFHVTDHGRLSHVALAKLMQEIQVLAYPTSFPEIDCITVKKAQAAGIDVITSGYAALQESVWSKDEPDIENIHDKPEELEKFTRRVIDALLKPMDTAARVRIAEETKRRYDWALIAKQWDEALA